MVMLARIEKAFAGMLISLGDALMTAGGKLRAHAWRREIRLVSSRRPSKDDAA